jgi:hypothetical protein
MKRTAEAAIKGGFVDLAAQGAEVGERGVAGLGFGGGQDDRIFFVAGDLDDAFDGFEVAAAVGQEAPSIFGAGELDGAVPGQEAAEGNDALLFARLLRGERRRGR